MKTLYDILGVSPTATEHQIREAYARLLVTLSAASGSVSPDENDPTILGKAAKEACQILSCPSRRSAYDRRLRSRQQAMHVPADGSRFSWGMALSVAILASLGSFHYYQGKAEETARQQLEAAKANANLRQMELAAAAEQLRLEREKHAAMRRAEERVLYEFEMARRNLKEEYGNTY